jgi:hypothetical protein
MMKGYRVKIGGLVLFGLIGFTWAAASLGRAGDPVIKIDSASKASERGRLHPALPVEGATRAPTIDRTVGLIRLGMTVEEFQKAVQSSEQTGMNPGLIEDERSFEIARDSLAPDIRVMGCRFLHGRLYRITVEYRENSFDQTQWDDRVKKNMERYGKVPVQSQRLGERPVEFIQWDDSNTRLLLQREHRMGFESKQIVKRYSVVMILLDQALWNERQEAEGLPF